MRSIVTNFEEKLKKLTAKESSIFFITPYDFSGKPFRGIYDGSSFDIIRNSFWGFTKRISIRGTFRSVDDHLTEIDYEIGLSKFNRIVSVIFFVVSLIAINTILLIHAKDKFILIPISGFWVFAGLWGLLANRIAKKIVTERFKTEFEIEDSDQYEETKFEN